MKKLLFLSIFLLLFACNKKELHLPQVAVSGIPMVQNFSELWVFYDAETGKAEINKNNLIGTTHWLINIDKRLPMEEVVPVFDLVREKRAKKTPHSQEGMADFITYSDLKDKKVGLFDIVNVEFIKTTKGDLSKWIENDSCDYILEFDKKEFWMDHKAFPIDNWQMSLLDSLPEGQIQLHFSADLTFQEYLSYMLPIFSELPEQLTLDPKEMFIDSQGLSQKDTEMGSMSQPLGAVEVH